MPSVEIYYDDLSEEKQQAALEAAGLATPEDGNWDVYPLAVLEYEADEEGNEAEVATDSRS